MDALKGMSTHLDLLIFGYIRFMEYRLHIIIPDEVQLIITEYMKKYAIYGIGRNKSGVFGLGNDSHETVIYEWTKFR